MKIVLSGEPKSTNSIYRHICRGKFPSVYMTHEGKAVKESYQWEAKTQMKGKIISGLVAVDIKLFFGRNGHHDIDNYNKLLLDALSGIVWEDDSQIIRSVIEKSYDKERPRIEITITPYD